MDGGTPPARVICDRQSLEGAGIKAMHCIESAVEGLYRQARLSTESACGAARLAIALFGPRCIRLVSRRAIPTGAALGNLANRLVIHLQKGLKPWQVNHELASVLSEWHLGKDYDGAPPDDLVRRLKAALCVPCAALISARRHFGDNVSALSAAFRVSESLMVLRVADVVGRSTAVITNRVVRTRGPKIDWPTTEQGWAELVGGGYRDRFVLLRLRDAKDRVALIAR